MDAIRTYLDMGGHGEFIWASYGAVMIVLAGLWIISQRTRQALKRELQSLEVDLPHRRARQRNET